MKRFLLYIAIVSLFLPVQGQTVTTAVPFLTINPDVRSAGMGNTGIALRPGVWAAFSNAAQYAFAGEKAGAAFSYTPWLKNWVDGQNLYALCGFYSIDDKSAVSVSGRYFTLPDFAFWDNEGNETGTVSPADFAVDVAYSRRFGQHFSAALTLRYIHSGTGDQVEGVEELETDGAVAGDLSLYYQASMKWRENCPGHWRIGLQLANLGSKISSYGTDAYLPAMLKLGGSVDVELKKQHTVALAVDFSRLLVEANTALKDNSVLSNVFGSFSNRAFFKSVVWAVGAEYDWKKQVTGRIGYNHESEMYGDRCYFTLGAGGRWKGISLDMSYLLSTGDSDAPYENTWRLGVGYCF